MASSFGRPAVRSAPHMRKGGSPEGEPPFLRPMQDRLVLKEPSYLPLTERASARAVRITLLAYSQLWMPQLPSEIT